MSALKFSRGLAALILIVISALSLHAEFLYKDDVVKNPKFTQQIELIGSELKAKTGISLYLVMLRDLDKNESITDFEKRISSEMNDSVVIMTFVELKKEVDILARPTSLYNSFDKGQILSPNATFIGAMVSSIMFARSFDDAKELLSNSGGTILPILAERAKGAEIVSKYSVAMYNGYADVAEQIAASKGQTLSTSAGTGSQTFIDVLRLIFYSIILYALYVFVRGRFFRKRETKSE